MQFLKYIHTLDEKPSLKPGWLLVVLLLVFVPHVYYSYLYMQDSIGPDLLLRTIGSRLQEAGKEIYTYKWHPGDPVTWLNPYPDTREGTNGVVSTPFFLWLLQPLARLQYCDVKLIAWIIIEVFMFATLLLSIVILKTRFKQFLFLSIATTFFLFDRNWILNVYNGQVYVMHAFVFALVAFVTLRTKRQRWNLFLLPLMSIVRPFFIVSCIAFWKFTWKNALVAFAGVSIAGILVFTTTDLHEWEQYSAAMKLYALEQAGESKVDSISYSAADLSKADQCTINTHPRFAIFGAGCLYSIQHYMSVMGYKISNVLFFQVILIVLILLLWWIAYKKKWLQSMPHQLMLCFWLYQFCELITPASRNPYNMIQWLPVMAWLVAFGDKKVIALTVIGLLLNHNFPFFFAYSREIGEMLMFAATALYMFQLKPAKFLSIRY